MKDDDSTLKIKTSGLVVLQGILLKLILSGFYVKILGQIFMIVLMRMESQKTDGEGDLCSYWKAMLYKAVTMLMFTSIS